MSYDVIVIGSGFGGAVTACRLAQAGMKVLILERGRRWEPKAGPGVTAYPETLEDPWIWDQENPELFNGWTDLRMFKGMSVVAGAGVGGGSLIYANVSIVPPDSVFKAPWPPEITADELTKIFQTKSTRILIYCNNNFLNAPRTFATKAAPASLNIHTFNTLFNYGYTNVYELGPLIDIRKAKLEFEGTQLKMP